MKIFAADEYGGFFTVVEDSGYFMTILLVVKMTISSLS